VLNPKAGYTKNKFATSYFIAVCGGGGIRMKLYGLLVTPLMEKLIIAAGLFYLAFLIAHKFAWG